MKPLTPEQRDWIKEYANTLVDEVMNGWKAFYTLCDWLDANTAEDEPYNPTLDNTRVIKDVVLQIQSSMDGYYSALLKAIGWRETKNQIALRKIEEYLNTKPHPEQMNELHVFYNWLQQEDE